MRISGEWQAILFKKVSNKQRKYQETLLEKLSLMRHANGCGKLTMLKPKIKNTKTQQNKEVFQYGNHERKHHNQI